MDDHPFRTLLEIFNRSWSGYRKTAAAEPA
jgi:hypothetical protein